MDNVLTNGEKIISKIQTSVFVENYCMYEYDFYMTVTRNEAATQKTLFLIPFFLYLTSRN